MARHQNAQWNLSDPIKTWPEVEVSVLMDIRDELQKLNSLLSCPHFVRIPCMLDEIMRNTKPKRRKRK